MEAAAAAAAAAAAELAGDPGPPPTRQRADGRVAAVERAAVGMAEEIVVSPEVQAELESKAKELARRSSLEIQRNRAETLRSTSTRRYADSFNSKQW